MITKLLLKNYYTFFLRVNPFLRSCHHVILLLLIFRHVYNLTLPQITPILRNISSYRTSLTKKKKPKTTNHPHKSSPQIIPEIPPHQQC